MSDLWRSRGRFACLSGEAWKASGQTSSTVEHLTLTYSFFVVIEDTVHIFQKHITNQPLVLPECAPPDDVASTCTAAVLGDVVDRRYIVRYAREKDLDRCFGCAWYAECFAIFLRAWDLTVKLFGICRG